MSVNEAPVGGEDDFEDTVRGDGGAVPMPSIAAESRGVSGGPEDQEVAEDRVEHDRDRVAEGYVRPGEPHTD